MRPSLCEADLGARVQRRTRAADVVLVFARDAHHHRRVRLLRQERRNRHRDVAGNAAAEAAAGVLADEDDCPVWRDADPARDRADRLHGALRARVQEQLAVLPVGHRRARLEHLMAGVLADPRLVEDERRVLEAGFDVAERPLVGVLAERQLPAGRGEVCVGPLQLADLGTRHRRPPPPRPLARRRPAAPFAATALGRSLPAGCLAAAPFRRASTCGAATRRRRSLQPAAPRAPGAPSAPVHSPRPRAAAARPLAAAAAPRRCPGVARVRAAGPQARDRIDRERQRLVLDLNASIASAAVSSSTAATARIGSPS